MIRIAENGRPGKWGESSRNEKTVGKTEEVYPPYPPLLNHYPIRERDSFVQLKHTHYYNIFTHIL
jgi:hypothetical protein